MKHFEFRQRQTLWQFSFFFSFFHIKYFYNPLNNSDDDDDPDDGMLFTTIICLPLLNTDN